MKSNWKEGFNPIVLKVASVVGAALFTFLFVCHESLLGIEGAVWFYLFGGIMDAFFMLVIFSFKEELGKVKGKITKHFAHKKDELDAFPALKKYDLIRYIISGVVFAMFVVVGVVDYFGKFIDETVYNHIFLGVIALVFVLFLISAIAHLIKKVECSSFDLGVLLVSFACVVLTVLWLIEVDFDLAIIILLPFILIGLFLFKVDEFEDFVQAFDGVSKQLKNDVEKTTQKSNKKSTKNQVKTNSNKEERAEKLESRESQKTSASRKSEN